MMKYLFSFIGLTIALLLAACSDDSDFSTSPGKLLSFSVDTLKMDTTFSNVPSPAKSFWVYNRSGSSLRCQSVRLERGNQSGFRVNVDGTYLGQSTGYQTQDVEIRRGDSIRVFVEVTSPENHAAAPKEHLDNLVFVLESGREQRVNLSAWSWDAVRLNNLRVSRDTTLSSQQPVVVYGGITVDSAATLKLAAGLTLYFHAGAGIQVRGSLKAEGEPGNEVTLRGDRLDWMFDYLPYDRMSGQWNGLRFYTSSYDNHLSYTDIHSTFDGILVDSSDVDKKKLQLDAVTVHNCQGYGLRALSSDIVLNNCQLSNTLRDCLLVNGGKAELNGCTLAQFYPFDSERGAALRFSNSVSPLSQLSCRNSLITGYAEDVVMGENADTTRTFNYHFADCILRTPKVTTKDSIYFERTLLENVKDTTRTGEKNFVTVDIDKQYYDFRLDSVSMAVDRANPVSSLPTDRRGWRRDDKPDIGAFELKH